MHAIDISFFLFMSDPFEAELVCSNSNAFDLHLGGVWVHFQL
jgi:hypothetical protein